jgi:hypothetical protein
MTDPWKDLKEQVQFVIYCRIEKEGEARPEHVLNRGLNQQTFPTTTCARPRLLTSFALPRLRSDAVIVGPTVG